MEAILNALETYAPGVEWDEVQDINGEYVEADIDGVFWVVSKDNVRRDDGAHSQYLEYDDVELLVKCMHAMDAATEAFNKYMRA